MRFTAESLRTCVFSRSTPLKRRGIVCSTAEPLRFPGHVAEASRSGVSPQELDTLVQTLIADDVRVYPEPLPLNPKSSSLNPEP